ncbi:MAG: hypothetical protein FWH34_08150, partial [Desulfovibrionaceae bacterium]|nr:hypothetical protein [Desulfovibrionaceae bacterium]
IREKSSVLSGGSADQMYLSLGDNLVTTASSSCILCDGVNRVCGNVGIAGRCRGLRMSQERANP